MFIGIGNTIPEIANLPGSSRPGGGGAFEYTAIDNSFSMEFDGTASYFDLDIDLSSFTNITTSLWVRWNSFANTYHFIFSAGTGSAAGDIFSIAKDWNVPPNANRLYTYDGLNSYFTNYVVSVGTWYHIVLTQSGTTRKIYVNGNEISSFTVGSLNLDNVVYLARYSRVSAYYAPVNIDEVSIWNTALSEETIQAIYNTTANNPGKVADLSETPEGAPAAWYRMGD